MAFMALHRRHLLLASNRFATAFAFVNSLAVLAAGQVLCPPPIELPPDIPGLTPPSIIHADFQDCPGDISWMFWLADVAAPSATNTITSTNASTTTSITTTTITSSTNTSSTSIPKASTTLTFPANAGDTILVVASVNGFQIGQGIIIDAGTSIEETNVITGFASIILQHPLQYNHSVGAIVSTTQVSQQVPSTTSTTTSTWLGVATSKGGYVRTGFTSTSALPNLAPVGKDHASDPSIPFVLLVIVASVAIVVCCVSCGCILLCLLWRRRRHRSSERISPGSDQSVTINVVDVSGPKQRKNAWPEAPPRDVEDNRQRPRAVPNNAIDVPCDTQSGRFAELNAVGLRQSADAAFPAPQYPRPLRDSPSLPPPPPQRDTQSGLGVERQQLPHLPPLGP